MGERPHSGTQVPHHSGGNFVVSRHIADDEEQMSVRQGHGVVEVSSYLDVAGSRKVPERQADTRCLGQRRRQEACLQDVRRVVLVLVEPGFGDHGRDLFGEVLGERKVLSGESATRPCRHERQ